MKNRKGIFILIILLAALGAARWWVGHKASTDGTESAMKKSDYYYCAMHPWFHQDHPGNCGICGMTLLKKEGGAVSREAEPNGLPESLKGLAAVDLSPFKQHLIGLRTSLVEEKPVVRVIRTVGRFAGGPNDFASATGDFVAHRSIAARKSRFLVADVYALDVPYVKVGQMAWVSEFSGAGSRWEGRVAQIYSYDGTQSRIQRVKIALSQAPASELFANVEIEAASQPMLSVSADAVMGTGLHRYVFVKKTAESFVPQEITVGLEGDNQWQVVSGLNGGETIVEGANFMVDADSKLSANFAAMESQEK